MGSPAHQHSSFHQQQPKPSPLTSGLGELPQVKPEIKEEKKEMMEVSLPSSNSAPSSASVVTNSQVSAVQKPPSVHNSPKIDKKSLPQQTTQQQQPKQSAG